MRMLNVGVLLTGVLALTVLVSRTPVAAMPSPPADNARAPAAARLPVGYTLTCSQPNLVYLATAPLELCLISVGEMAWWLVTATWDVDPDSTSTDAYGHFVGEVTYLRGWDIAIGEGVMSINVLKQASYGPTPRFPVTRSFIASSLGQDRFRLTARKTYGSGWTLTYPGHTSLQMVKIRSIQ